MAAEFVLIEAVPVDLIRETLRPAPGPIFIRGGAGGPALLRVPCPLQDGEDVHAGAYWHWDILTPRTLYGGWRR